MAYVADNVPGRFAKLRIYQFVPNVGLNGEVFRLYPCRARVYVMYFQGNPIPWRFESYVDHNGNTVPAGGMDITKAWIGTEFWTKSGLIITTNITTDGATVSVIFSIE